MDTKEIREKFDDFRYCRLGSEAWADIQNLCDEVDEQQKVIDAQYKDIDRLTEALEKIDNITKDAFVADIAQAALNPPKENK